jgi:hypothetical protein
LQSAYPEAHRVPQAPSTHVGSVVGPLGHTLSHALQFEGSSLMLVHELPPHQSESEPHGTHAPATHISLSAHRVPHAPQASWLLVRKVSQPALLSQSPRPALHAKPHVPLVHAGVAFGTAGHTCPQAPQLSGFEAVLTQAPLHDVMGGTQGAHLAAAHV